MKLLNALVLLLSTNAASGQNIRGGEAKANETDLATATMPPNEFAVSSSTGASALTKADDDGTYIVSFTDANDNEVECSTNPRSGHIHISSTSPIQGVDLNQDALADIAQKLQVDDGVNTFDTDEIGTQTMRCADLLSTWPKDRYVEYTYDPSMMKERTERISFANNRTDTSTPTTEDEHNEDEYDEDGNHVSGHHHRHLAFYNACKWVNHW